MPENSTTYLEWDSNFFGFNVSKIEFEDIKWFENQIEQEFSNGIKLIYGITKNTILEKLLLEKHNGELVDVKVWFVKKMKPLNQINKKIEPLSIIEGDIDQLYKLGFQSGEYSRFKIDKKLPSKTFEKLYKLWIDHSVNGEFSDQVFVYRSNSIIEGFITLSIKEKFGEIGLIAVSDKMRGKNIGSMLLAKAESFLLENKIYLIKVATQSDNIKACRFYKKNEYHIDEKIKIYHFYNK